MTDQTYADFTPKITDRRTIAERVKTDPGVATAQTNFLQTLETWWTNNLPLVIALAPNNNQKGNVYLRADQRACVAALENLHGKYAVTAKQIEAKRDEAAVKLKGFLVELGYE